MEAGDIWLVLYDIILHYVAFGDHRDMAGSGAGAACMPVSALKFEKEGMVK